MVFEEVEQGMLSLASLGALEYCPHFFFYLAVYGVGTSMDDTSMVERVWRREEGAHLRARLGLEGYEARPRRVWLWSSRFGISGFSHAVEERNGQLIPVEYREEGPRQRWMHDYLQLCAQALCLEEMTGRCVPFGYVFMCPRRDSGSDVPVTEDGVPKMRCEQVSFTETMRQQTESALFLASTLLQRRRIPPPLLDLMEEDEPVQAHLPVASRARLPRAHPKCQHCSLQSRCLPREVLQLERDAPHPLFFRTRSRKKAHFLSPRNKEKN